MYRLFYTKGSELFATRVVLEEIGAPYTANTFDTFSVHNGGSDANQRAGLSIADGNNAALGFLSDTSAMLVFLARRHPEAELLPNDPYGEAKCLEWMSWLSICLSGGTFEQVRHPDRFVLDPNTYREVITKGWWTTEDHFDRNRNKPF